MKTLLTSLLIVIPMMTLGSVVTANPPSLQACKPALEDISILAVSERCQKYIAGLFDRAITANIEDKMETILVKQLTKNTEIFDFEVRAFKFRTRTYVTRLDRRAITEACYLQKIERADHIEQIVDNSACTDRQCMSLRHAIDRMINRGSIC